MRKKILTATGIFLLLLLAGLTTYALSTVKHEIISIRNSPNGTDNVFILTIDDLTMLDSYELYYTVQIVNYLNSKEIPATFFAIPSKMKPYNFSSNFEIAQHGYDHLNPIDGSYNEFHGVEMKEIERRLNEGKRLLDDMGYDIKGNRAPGWSLTKEAVPFLIKNYDYDSSFQSRIPEYNNFLIYPLWMDLHVIGNTEKFMAISSLDANKHPIVIVSHFWSYEKMINSNNSADTDRFFDEINSRNYWKTTMGEYDSWRDSLNSVNFTSKKSNGVITVDFNRCLAGLTFDTKEIKKVESNCDIDCSLKNGKQVCTIQEN